MKTTRNKGIRKTRRQRKGFSLTFKISLTITLLIVLLMVGLGSLTYYLNHRMLWQQETSHGRSVAALAGEMMAPVLAAGDDAALKEGLILLRDDIKIVEAYITDPAGEVLAHEQPASIGNRMQSRALRSAIDTGTVQVQETINDLDSRPVLLFVAPLQNESGEVLGYLHFQTDFSPVEHFLTATAMQWIQIFVVMVLFSLILIRIIIIRTVGRRVRELMAATEEAGMGNFSNELVPASRDELGQLTEGFNAMNRQLGMLFRSMNQSVEEVEYTTRQIVDRAETMAAARDTWPFEKQQEWTREILGSGKRLLRVTDKLQAFLNQFKTRDEEE